MHREVEAKILNVNPEDAQRRLLGLGAVLSQELDLEQVVWWIPGTNQESVRVRRSSDGLIRLTMKQKVKEGFGYYEWESDVTSYENTMAIIDALLPQPELRIAYAHHRQDWYLGNALININWFPQLAPLLEIEAESEEQVKTIAGKLGFNEAELVNKGVVSLLFDALGLKKGDKVNCKVKTENGG